MTRAEAITQEMLRAPEVSLYQGDCLEIMPTLEACSIDAIVTDPPYGLSFMGKHWDHGLPGIDFWVEALRVAKPGTHLLAFGGTRTFHRLTCTIEDAGWEIRDCIMWVYGSGFPKSLDVSKAIDKEAGAERIRTGRRRHAADGTVIHKNGSDKQAEGWARPFMDLPDKQKNTIWETIPATDAAFRWQGWGTALKPAWEPIILARKPIEGTVAENVQKHGTGAMNIDGCRIGNDAGWKYPNGRGGTAWGNRESLAHNLCEPMQSSGGRFPANLIHDGSEEVVDLFPTNAGASAPASGYLYEGPRAISNAMHAMPGMGNRAPSFHGDSGSASRFFYCAKASKADRDEGIDTSERRMRPTTGDGIGGQPNQRVENAKNNHPTVKPTALMRYLCRLITPPGGIVLDPFVGSGSTGKAAIIEGFNFIGIEKESEYVEIAKARIAAAQKQGTMLL